MTSIIESMVTYFETYDGIDSDEPVQVNYLGSEVDKYTLVPLPGGGVLEEYINGSQIIEFFFALQTGKSTADDPARTANITFLENVSKWLKTQNDAGTFPILDTGETALEIEPVGALSGFLLQEGESGTGIYQLGGRLEYSKV